MSEKKSLIVRLGERFGTDGMKLYETLKQTAFSTGANKAPPSDAQMQALLLVADQHGLNPFTKEIYAFPDQRGGIIPVVGVDGWIRIANEHSQCDGFEFRESDEMVQLDERTKNCPVYCEVTVHRKDRKHPVIVREYLDEVYRPPVKKHGGRGEYFIDGPWQSHPKRMLRHKAIIQAFRLAFGFSGIYDPDEAERIREQQEKDMGVVEVVDNNQPLEIIPDPVTTQANTQQAPVLEHQQQHDLMGQIAGQQVMEATVKQPEPAPTQTLEPQPQPIEQVAFKPSQQLFDMTINLISRSKQTGIWDMSFDFARQQWQGEEQTYVLNELEKARSAA